MDIEVDNKCTNCEGHIITEQSRGGHITILGYELPCGKECPYAHGNVIKELTKDELYFHEKVNPPMADGRQCYKAYGYYDSIDWLTEEKQAKWKEIDDRLKLTNRRPQGWENYKCGGKIK